MKKIIGWLFIISGVGNLVRVFAFAASGSSYAGHQPLGGILFFAIGCLGFGIWLNGWFDADRK